MLPGGVLELDQAPFEGVREVFEETEVKVGPERLTGVYKNMKQGVVSLAILCRPVSGEPQPSDAAIEAMPEARAR